MAHMFNVNCLMFNWLLNIVYAFQVEIAGGSGVYIKRIKHTIACNRYTKSPAVMARYLLRQILGEEYLMTHSALGKGQKSEAADQNVLVSVDRECLLFVSFF